MNDERIIYFVIIPFFVLLYIVLYREHFVGPANLFKTLKTLGFAEVTDANRAPIDTLLINQFRREFEPESVKLVQSGGFKLKQRFRALLVKETRLGALIACDWRIGKGIYISYELIPKEKLEPFGIAHKLAPARDFPYLRECESLSDKYIKVFTDPKSNPSEFIQGISRIFRDLKRTYVALDCRGDRLTIEGHLGRGFSDVSAIKKLLNQLQ